MEMWKRRQAGALRKEIRAMLAFLPGATGLKGLIKESLTGSGQGPGFYAEGARPWPLLPLLACRSISGNCQQALPLAASLELLKAAAEIFDDIEDADSSQSIPARYGSAVALNTATALLVLAEKGITRLSAVGVDDRIIVRIMEMINTYYITACTGQHLDLSIPAGKRISEKVYLKISGMKSAFAVECACSAGALLATEDQELIELFAAFGHNLGMASQIANDIQGINSGADIIKGKVTLPVIYALTQTNGEIHDELEAAFLKTTGRPVLTVNMVRDRLFQTGAIHYAAIKMESYQQQAKEALDRIQAAGIAIEQLELFLE